MFSANLALVRVERSPTAGISLHSKELVTASFEYNMTDYYTVYHIVRASSSCKEGVPM
jgi:hypothetical protein